jgi:hypothetical protein
MREKVGALLQRRAVNDLQYEHGADLSNMWCEEELL